MFFENPLNVKQMELRKKFLELAELPIPDVCITMGGNVYRYYYQFFGVNSAKQIDEIIVNPKKLNSTLFKLEALIAALKEEKNFQQFKSFLSFAMNEQDVPQLLQDRIEIPTRLEVFSTELKAIAELTEFFQQAKENIDLLQALPSSQASKEESDSFWIGERYSNRIC